jgi:hypothetical protein
MGKKLCTLLEGGIERRRSERKRKREKARKLTA